MAADRVAIVFGGPSPEHDISVLTALQCERSLAGAGVEVVPIYWTPAGAWFAVPPGAEGKDFVGGPPAGAEPLELLVDADGGFFTKGKLGRRRRLEVPVALLCLHGGPGEAGILQGILELVGIPYTGAPSWGSMLGMDKLAQHDLVVAAGVPALPRLALRPGVRPPFDGPYIVKPRFGGSSVGIEVVDDVDTAVGLLRASVHLRRGAVIEPYREDAVDLNLGVRTWPEFQVSLLEKPVRGASGPIYSYAEKYLGGGQGAGLETAPRELPAQVPDEVTAAATEHARVVVDVLGLRGLARIDYLLVDGTLQVNEVNTIPGTMGLYLWPKDVPISRLLLDTVDEAERAGVAAWPTAGADGTALQAASGISAKLLRYDEARG